MDTKSICERVAKNINAKLLCPLSQKTKRRKQMFPHNLRIKNMEAHPGETHSGEKDRGRDRGQLCFEAVLKQSRF